MDLEIKGVRRSVPTGTAGYSLLEVMVTLAILAALMGIALPQFNARRFRVNAAQQTVIANLRLARANAITKNVHFRLAFTGATQLQMQRMFQDANGNWQVDTLRIETISLPAVTRLRLSLVGTGVEFNSRGLAVNLTAPAQIDIFDDYGATKSLQAWPSGQVNAL